MDTDIGESTTRQPVAQSSGSSMSDAGNFECNICFDLAQDPIVTLCGHLFCWPCLYRWLHIHSHSRECPVCKAVIVEEKLIPLYGRGNAPSGPLSRSELGMDIPRRPAGQQLETAPSHEDDNFHHHHHHHHHHHYHQPRFGLIGGFAPMSAARWGNFSFPAGIGGLFPSLFNRRLHGFPYATVYGPGGSFPYGFPNGFHGRHLHHWFPRRHVRGPQAVSHLTLLLIIVGVLVVLVHMGL